jgi:hypothetical protein
MTSHMPVFNTRTGFHHLKFGSNTGYTATYNIVEIYHWCIAYQLDKPNITISKIEFEKKQHEKKKEKKKE